MAQKTNPQMEDLLSTTFQNRYESQFALENYLSILGSLPNLCAAWVGGHAAFEEARWYDWTPTISAGGSMTVSSTTIHLARFCIHGRVVKYDLQFTTTLGGAASFNVEASAPVTIAQTINMHMVQIEQPSNRYSVGYTRPISSSKLGFFLDGRGNFPLETTRFWSSGFYQI